MSDDAKVFFAGMGVGFLAGGIFIIAMMKDSRKSFDPPCGYGATEILVREKDNSARIVCGCPK